MTLVHRPIKLGYVTAVEATAVTYPGLIGLGPRNKGHANGTPRSTAHYAQGSLRLASLVALVLVVK